MCTFGGSVLRRLRDSQSNEDGFSVHRKSPAACRIRQPERSACAPCMGGLRNQRQSANERTAGGTWSLENESGLMNLLRLSISPLPAPAGWYALPLRLIIGFGFMQHGYAKLKQPCQLADAQESSDSSTRREYQSETCNRAVAKKDFGACDIWHRPVTRGGLAPRLKLAHDPVGDLLITCARIAVAPQGSVSWRAIPHVAPLMRATCLEEAGG